MFFLGAGRVGEGVGGLRGLDDYEWGCGEGFADHAGEYVAGDGVDGAGRIYRRGGMWRWGRRRIRWRW